MGKLEFDLITPEEWKKTQVQNQNEIKSDYEKAIETDNFWNLLYTDLDRVKADANHDQKISYEEYRNYILSKETEPTYYQPSMVHVYKLDVSFYIVFGMLCITAIIIALICKRSK